VRPDSVDLLGHPISMVRLDTKDCYSMIYPDMTIYSMPMKKITVAISSELEQRLAEERKKRLVDGIPEVVRMILSEYFSKTAI